jgi:hypothetical protein
LTFVSIISSHSLSIPSATSCRPRVEARVVDEDVDRAEPFQRRRDERFRRVHVPHVERSDERFRSVRPIELRRQLLEAVEPPGAEGQTHAERSERPGRRFSDARRRARDQNDLSGKTHRAILQLAGTDRPQSR